MRLDLRSLVQAWTALGTACLREIVVLRSR